MAEQKIDPLFKLLIERTRMLVTVCDNAAEVISEDFKDMVTGPMDLVNQVLAQCPDVAAWDGSFSEEDIIVEPFAHDTQTGRGDIAVRIRHVPTDLSVESYSKRTLVENELVARKALAVLVEKRWEAEREAAEQVEGAPTRRRSRSRT